MMTGRLTRKMARHLIAREMSAGEVDSRQSVFRRLRRGVLRAWYALPEWRER